MKETESLISLILIAAGIFVYFLPMIIGALKDHKNMLPIALVNIFLGWSLIGWVAALVWAFIDNSKIGSHGDNYEKIDKLSKLRDSGVITDEEFDREKKKLLG